MKLKRAEEDILNRKTDMKNMVSFYINQRNILFKHFTSNVECEAKGLMYIKGVKLEHKLSYIYYIFRKYLSLLPVIDYLFSSDVDYGHPQFGNVVVANADVVNNDDTLSTHDSDAESGGELY